MDSKLVKWRPTDDLLLIESVLEVNNLAVVHACVEFSCKFTLAEVEQRWQTLLYDENESKIAQEAILNLPSNVVKAIKSNAVWSKTEEDALSEILSTDDATLATFECLYVNDMSLWKSCRTPEALYKHWQLMKKYQLLKDQLISNESDDDEEGTELNTVLPLCRSPNPHTIPLLDKEIEITEEKVEIWQGRLNQSLLEPSETSHKKYPSNSPLFMAILCGENVSYLINKTNVSVGIPRRNARSVDIDLSLDGCRNDPDKVNCIIRYQDGCFKIINLSDLPIIVSDQVLIAHTEATLTDNCDIKIGHSYFTFIFPRVHNAILSNRPPFECFTNLKAPNTQFLRKVAQVSDKNVAPQQMLVNNQQPPPLANFIPTKPILQLNSHHTVASNSATPVVTTGGSNSLDLSNTISPTIITPDITIQNSTNNCSQKIPTAQVIATKKISSKNATDELL